MATYTSTLLAQSNDAKDIQKADLDLLKKINEVNDRIDNSGSSTSETKAIISGQIGAASTDPTAPQVLAFGDFWTNQGVRYDVTTKRFYIMYDGVYRITMNPFFYTGITSTRVLVGINTDAPDLLNHKGDTFQGTSTYDTGCINSIIELNAGDYVVFYLREGKLYNKPGTDLFNQFSIEKIANTVKTDYNVEIVTGGASTIITNNLVPSRALASDSEGKVVVSAVSSTELGYLEGVTSAIQTQINSKSTVVAPGSPPIYGVRAWGVFNSTLATPSLLAGGNMTMTRYSPGRYRITFTTAMPDKYYAVSGSNIGNSSGSFSWIAADSTYRNTTTSGFDFILINNSGTAVDSDHLNIMVVR